ncbi:hypothetical protein NPIL_537701 [Nephila pilipes]|uniref:Uncharacterized protein n=1 Tax=Nephila pilipes TaxID=299642 RepID=A0A8X6QG95_NEPPI|nr:hypothetical protein NPIL_537701 [Nephila pilipes]
MGSCSKMRQVSVSPMLVTNYECGVDVETNQIQQQLWQLSAAITTRQEGVMVWGEIAYDLMSPLICIQSPMMIQ